MLSLKKKDNKLKQAYFFCELRLLLNKVSFFHGVSFFREQHIRLFIFKFLKRRSYFLRSKNRLFKRCLITNRSRSTFKNFYLSRIILRDLLGFGIVPGFKKAVW